jgi:hypothetical protein
VCELLKVFKHTKVLLKNFLIICFGERNINTLPAGPFINATFNLKEMGSMLANLLANALYDTYDGDDQRKCNYRDARTEGLGE